MTKHQMRFKKAVVACKREGANKRGQQAWRACLGSKLKKG